ncbi:uncharacterized protein [Acropora muricata]
MDKFLFYLATITFMLTVFMSGSTRGHDSFFGLYRAPRSGPPLAKNQNPVCKKAQLLHSDIVQNASLEGQLHAGNFSFLGDVKDMEECMSLCCASKRCQLAYMDNAKCYGVKCYSEELCKITTAYSTNDVKISLMVRNDINRKAYVTAYIVVVLVAFGAAVSGTVWAVFIFVRRYRENGGTKVKDEDEEDATAEPKVY